MTQPTTVPAYPRRLRTSVAAEGAAVPAATRDSNAAVCSEIAPSWISRLPYIAFTAPGYSDAVRAAAAIVALACLLGASHAAASPGSTKPIRATFVGDSVSASISYVPAAQRALGNGLSVRLDLKVCRRLVEPSCSFQGSAPPSALQAVQRYGRSLGRVLIVKVGYNEGSQGYGAGIDRVMRAALADGASGVVWVTLREGSQYRGIYHATNLEIKTAAKRWPELVVADWNSYSAGKPWFRSDGLHLTAGGAEELAAFLRPYIFRAAAIAG